MDREQATSSRVSMLNPSVGRLYVAGRGQAPPPGAIAMSDSEVLKFQRELIAKFRPKESILSLQYGTVALGFGGSLGGILVNNYFRECLRIAPRVGFVASYMPAVFLASIGAALFHKGFVLDRILLGQSPCSMCMELRSGTVQALMGLVYPLGFAPFASLFLARRHNTYPLTPGGVKVWSLIGSFVKPAAPYFLAGLCAQFAFGVFVASRETREVDLLWNKHVLSSQQDPELQDSESLQS